ncbi:unnamed protein product [Parajaminaea phylloscopi]
MSPTSCRNGRDPRQSLALDLANVARSPSSGTTSRAAAPAAGLRIWKPAVVGTAGRQTLTGIPTRFLPPVPSI